MLITDKDTSTLGLLFNESPLLIRKELAKRIGLNEAIILQQVHFHIQNKYKAVKEKDRQDDRAWHDGTFWTYNTYEEWQENEFPFWSIRTLKRTFKKMEDEGLLLSGKFNKMKTDQTKWYTVNYEKLMENDAQTLDTEQSDNVAPCTVDHSDKLAPCTVDHSDKLAPSIVTDCPTPKCQSGTMLPKTNKEVLKDSSSQSDIDSELRSQFPDKPFDEIKEKLLADETVIIETKNQYRKMLAYRLEHYIQRKESQPRSTYKKTVRKEQDPDQLFETYKSVPSTGSYDDVDEMLKIFNS